VTELAARNIPVSSSEVDCLGKKFVVYLAIAHRQSSSQIKEAMRMEGGYVLHLDATFDAQGPLLMSGIDAITEIVLGNVKLASENAEKIIPFLQDLKRRFGDPVASVHDMGAGIARSVEEVFEGMADFICHFHFLRDIGKDLFQRENDTIRRRTRLHRMTTKLRSHARELKKIIDADPPLVDSFRAAIEKGARLEAAPESIRAISAYSLIQWVLDGKNQGHGYGFPFDRPHLVFVERLCLAHLRLKHIARRNAPGASRVERTICKLSRDLKIVASDPTLNQTTQAMKQKTAVFDQLRDAMRMAPDSGRDGLNCDGVNTDIQTIEKAVNAFRRKLRARPEFSKSKPYNNIIKQIDKYRDKLFSDPITVNAPTGKITIQPQRTNNIMERFFREFKRGYRRRTGNRSMGKTIKAMIADTPLVKNLNNPQYIDLLLDGQATLQQRFAKIDVETVRRELKIAQQSPERIPAKIKKLINRPRFPEEFTKILAPPALTA
jgi:hypothetical protein